MVHLWACLNPLGLGTIDYWLHLSLSSSLSLSLFSPVPAALSIRFAAAPEVLRLAVRLWVVGCPPLASRPKVGGPVGWLFAPVGLCTFNLLLRWLSRLGACITVDLVSCCVPALVYSVS